MLEADTFSGTGIHTDSHVEGCFTADYLRRVKNGTRSFKDDDPNKLKVKKLIKSYKKELKKYGVTI